jgi:hypothetical protein
MSTCGTARLTTAVSRKRLENGLSGHERSELHVMAADNEEAACLIAARRVDWRS